MMSTNAIQTVEAAEPYQETLAEQMAGQGFSLSDTLRCATEIATTLRDLHAQGLIYGAVSSQLILITQAGAVLRNTGGLARLGDGECDVRAFGEVLQEMAGRAKSAAASDRVRDEVLLLAAHCQEAAPDMRQVLISLRLLALQARQSELPVRRTLVVHPLAKTKPSYVDQIRMRIRHSFHWKPLANLAAFAAWGK